MRQIFREVLVSAVLGLSLLREDAEQRAAGVSLGFAEPPLLGLVPSHPQQSAVRGHNHLPKAVGRVAAKTGRTDAIVVKALTATDAANQKAERSTMQAPGYQQPT
jgi:hypothetical protein